MSQMWVAPFLASLPPWWRLLQCFRRYRDSNEQVHLLNAAKYTSSIMAAIVTGVRRMYRKYNLYLAIASRSWLDILHISASTSMTIFWVITCIFNSCYTSTWDIKMDWGLLRPQAANFLLRDELVFYRWVKFWFSTSFWNILHTHVPMWPHMILTNSLFIQTYYVAVPINVLLRFSWMVTLLSLRMNGQLLAILLALLEAYRRIQWNFFRLENEVWQLHKSRETCVLILLIKKFSISTIVDNIAQSKIYLYHSHYLILIWN